MVVSVAAVPQVETEMHLLEEEIRVQVEQWEALVIPELRAMSAMHPLL